jgi:hypothetical protein
MMWADSERAGAFEMDAALSPCLRMGAFMGNGRGLYANQAAETVTGVDVVAVDPTAFTARTATS